MMGGKSGSGCCRPRGLSRGLVRSLWGVLVVSLSVVFQKFVHVVVVEGEVFGICR